MTSENLPQNPFGNSSSRSRLLIRQIDEMESKVRLIEESLTRATATLQKSMSSRIDSYFRNEEFIEFDEFSEGDGTIGLVVGGDGDEFPGATDEVVRSLESTREHLRSIQETIHDLQLSS